ncbi:MAG: DUF2993 domain-containing protein [Firmicutes bacterium]|nr:LmeA family phospholipid-binding protein [Bacillota bacterium]NLO66771.1 DUF2993 domain-containing protein [Bacillota bacterium]
MRRRWLFAAVFCLVLFVLAIPKLFVVPRLSQRLEAELIDYFSAEGGEVYLIAPWGWELLFGRIPAADMVLTNVRVDGLTLAQVEVQGRDIRFAWEEGEFVYQGASDLTGTLTVTEEALNEIYWREVDPERDLRVEIEPDQLVLVGAVPFWTTEISIELRGSLEVWGRSGLRLVLQNLEVESTRVPPFLLEVLNENYDVTLDLSIFPEPTEISAVVLEQGKVLIDIGVVR